jgi:hypothetical protein
MERTERGSFWDAWGRALAASLTGLGLVLLVVLVGAQGPVDKNDKKVVPIQKSSLAVNLSLAPGKQESELQLRVQTKPLVKLPPEVEFQDMAGGIVRTVKIEPGEQGEAWVATITQLQPFGVGYINVTVTDDAGGVERHELRFATRGTVKNQVNVVYSVDGQFAFVTLPGAALPATRFLVNTLELPDPPLPPGVNLVAGPFEIITTQQVPDQLSASVVIHFAAKSPNSGPLPSYQVRSLKPDRVTWEVLPGEIEQNRGVAQAAVSRLGIFVLTSQSK